MKETIKIIYITLKQNGETSLMLAARYQNKEILKFLLREGIDVNDQSKVFFFFEAIVIQFFFYLALPALACNEWLQKKKKKIK